MGTWAVGTWAVGTRRGACAHVGRQEDAVTVPHGRCGHESGESQPGREAGAGVPPAFPALAPEACPAEQGCPRAGPTPPQFLPWMCGGLGSGWEPGRPGTHGACLQGAPWLPGEMTGRGQRR